MDPEDGYIVFRTIKERVEKLMNSRLGSMDISAAAGFFLVEIGFNEGISMKELSKALMVDKSLTTRNMKYLIENGFVENISTNRKTYGLRLTEKGEEMAKHICDVRAEVAEELTRCLTDDERKNFWTIISKIQQSILNGPAESGEAE